MGFDIANGGVDFGVAFDCLRFDVFEGMYG